ncbi:MAG TPA: hypothetical protein VLD36_00460 [Burkholderiales bacterium]|jgi:hypothetical protein|nr:hypothetical protein [Burkholderiales bacterium]
MPYYVFKIHEGPIRRLERLGEFERFPDASGFAKESRARLAAGERCAVRVAFGVNELAAEEALFDPREPPPRIGDDY